MFKNENIRIYTKERRQSIGKSQCSINSNPRSENENIKSASVDVLNSFNPKNYNNRSITAINTHQSRISSIKQNTYGGPSEYGISMPNIKADSSLSKVQKPINYDTFTLPRQRKNKYLTQLSQPATIEEKSLAEKSFSETDSKGNFSIKKIFLHF